LRAVDPDEVEITVLVAESEGDRRGAALSRDLDHVAFGKAHLGEDAGRNARVAASEVMGSRAGDLKADDTLGDGR
jgi:hypothetical protein